MADISTSDSNFIELRCSQHRKTLSERLIGTISFMECGVMSMLTGGKDTFLLEKNVAAEFSQFHFDVVRTTNQTPFTCAPVY